MVLEWGKVSHISPQINAEWFYASLHKCHMNYKNIWEPDYIIWKLSK
jgi:hypothetical protein